MCRVAMNAQHMIVQCMSQMTTTYMLNTHTVMSHGTEGHCMVQDSKKDLDLVVCNQRR